MIAFTLNDSFSHKSSSCVVAENSQRGRVPPPHDERQQSRMLAGRRSAGGHAEGSADAGPSSRPHLHIVVRMLGLHPAWCTGSMRM